MHTLAHDGLVLDVLDGGPTDGELVVLLHGFPQDATAWGRVAPHLHRAGLRTLALHQRGYSRGARPRRVSAYSLRELVGDVLALLDAAGAERAHIVGHDWGGAVAWTLAQRHPERVSSLVVLSTPHPAALWWAIRHSDQLGHSWYMLVFQLPVVPELLLARLLRSGALHRWGVPGGDSRRYALRLGRSRALRGPINWYRAALRQALRRPAELETAVTVPTTYVWGARDPFLGRVAAERTARHVAGDYRFVEVDAGHWLPEREPVLVAQEVLARIAAVSHGVGAPGHED
ncbi:alpha/beta fold hydrolase [Ornithinimicrobium sp. F0845]|uniref:alpha/beta fold hydrolase n=1 Tax=Ornithinimicrobium sp. F0845 TaxID=2926412 RepID=UPI001FF34C61|nr:alpha/beta fold hydrolase [Ornithinimicrobium sp. F0845]MCK0113200.1 alpha/beta fold hydrolase [Ornithinimicrobium sp. F0845]